MLVWVLTILFIAMLLVRLALEKRAIAGRCGSMTEAAKPRKAKAPRRRGRSVAVQGLLQEDVLSQHAVAQHECAEASVDTVEEAPEDRPEGAPCGCGVASGHGAWGCQPHAVYSRDLLLAHRAIRQRAARGAPGLPKPAEELAESVPVAIQAVPRGRVGGEGAEALRTVQAERVPKRAPADCRHQAERLRASVRPTTQLQFWDACEAC